MTSNHTAPTYSFTEVNTLDLYILFYLKNSSVLWNIYFLGTTLTITGNKKNYKAGPIVGIH